MNDQEQEKQDEQPQHEPVYEEKTDEKLEKEEKKREEKRRDDPLGSLSWALILIWAGLVFLADNLGWLDQVQVELALPEGLDFIGLRTWPLIFLGAGLIVFTEALIRTFAPAYRTSDGGDYIWAAILLGIGLSGIFGWQLIWPLILIFLGLSILVKALIRQRR